MNLYNFVCGMVVIGMSIIAHVMESELLLLQVIAIGIAFLIGKESS